MRRCGLWLSATIFASQTILAGARSPGRAAVWVAPGLLQTGTSEDTIAIPLVTLAASIVVAVASGESSLLSPPHETTKLAAAAMAMALKVLIFVDFFMIQLPFL